MTHNNGNRKAGDPRDYLTRKECREMAKVVLDREGIHQYTVRQIDLVLAEKVTLENGNVEPMFFQAAIKQTYAKRITNYEHRSFIKRIEMPEFHKRFMKGWHLMSQNCTTWDRAGRPAGGFTGGLDPIDAFADGVSDEAISQIIRNQTRK